MNAHRRTVGLTLSKRIVAGLVDDSGIAGPLQSFPEDQQQDDALVELPRERLIEAMCQEIVAVARESAQGPKEVASAGSTRESSPLAAVGIALPGIVRNGVVEDSPNLPQLKGARVAAEVGDLLREHGVHAPITVVNDADALAAGLAATHGKLDHMIRVWTIGTGIGFGRHPLIDGIGEGGHTVVTLDDKETFCGCGGRGHIEGIMGHRAMRLRFLDMEPEDVFEAADAGDERCLAFKKLWHKALAAGTATSVHMSGAGKFYLTGYNVRFVDLSMLHHYIEQMVRMSPLQGFSVETRPEEVANEILGAAVIARQAAAKSLRSFPEGVPIAV